MLTARISRPRHSDARSGPVMKGGWSSEDGRMSRLDTYRVSAPPDRVVMVMTSATAPSSIIGLALTARADYSTPRWLRCGVNRKRRRRIIHRRRVVSDTLAASRRPADLGARLRGICVGRPAGLVHQTRIAVGHRRRWLRVWIVDSALLAAGRSGSHRSASDAAQCLEERGHSDRSRIGPSCCIHDRAVPFCSRARRGDVRIPALLGTDPRAAC